MFVAHRSVDRMAYSIAGAKFCIILQHDLQDASMTVMICDVLIRIESCRHIWPPIFAGVGLCVGWTLLLAPWQPWQPRLLSAKRRPLEKLLDKMDKLKGSTEVYGSLRKSTEV